MVQGLQALLGKLGSTAMQLCNQDCKQVHTHSASQPIRNHHAGAFFSFLFFSEFQNFRCTKSHVSRSLVSMLSCEMSYEIRPDVGSSAARLKGTEGTGQADGGTRGVTLLVELSPKGV